MINAKFQKNLLENGAKKFMHGIYLAYSVFQMEKILRFR